MSLQVRAGLGGCTAPQREACGKGQGGLTLAFPALTGTSSFQTTNETENKAKQRRGKLSSRSDFSSPLSKGCLPKPISPRKSSGR